MSNSPDVLENKARWLLRARPFPDRHASIDYRRRFSAAEARKMLDGFIPRDMDDKWFIAMQPAALDFYRSWTGYHIYRLVVRETADGIEAGPLLANRDEEQYRSPGDDFDVATVNRLIDSWLLGRG
jgi:hypothetical protein